MNDRILIVEDEPHLREVLCDYFRSKGDLPAEAENGARALELITSAAEAGLMEAMEKLVAMAVKSCGEHKRYNLAVANGGCPEDMEKVKAKLMAALPDCDQIWAGEIDCTLSSYIGDGILGAAVQVLD